MCLCTEKMGLYTAARVYYEVGLYQRKEVLILR